MNYCAGIDLGTTNTVCAIWKEGDDRPRVISITQPYDDLVPEGFRRDDLLPSALTIQPQGLFVGQAARLAGRIVPWKTFTSIKRQMGRHWYKRIDNTDWTPERVSACILLVVRREMEAMYGGTPHRVVITVPASFGTEARRATLRAAAIAGFNPQTIRLFDEPTAALLSEFQEHGVINLDGPTRRVMMVDIGGGTLDVSLMELRRQGEQVIADILGRSRFNELAGDDFDLAIAGLVLARYEAERKVDIDRLEPNDARRLCVDLLLRAEDVKQRFSLVLANRTRSEWVDVREPVTIAMTPDNVEWTTELNGEDLIVALRDFFPKSDDAATRSERFSFFRPIQQCLDSAALITGLPVDIQDIQEVLLAGGSALLPLVPRAIRDVLKVVPHIVSDPMKAVALGAAWYAGLPDYGTSQFVVQDRLFDGIYLQAANGRFVELVSPRVLIPMERRSYGEYLSMSRDDSRLEINLFVGTSDVDPHMAPLARRRVDFQEIVPQGNSITLSVSVTENRQAEFAFETIIDGRSVLGKVEVSTASAWETDATPVEALPSINLSQE